MRRTMITLSQSLCISILSHFYYGKIILTFFSWIVHTKKIGSYATLNNFGVTGGNKVIQLVLVFLSGEEESNFDRVLVHLKGIMAIEWISFPLSIVTYTEFALIKSLGVDFPSIPHLLCRWDVNMNVLAISKKYFVPPTRQGSSYARSSVLTEFLSQWNNILAATSEEIYYQVVAKLKTVAPKEAYCYVERTWLVWKEKLVGFWVDRHLHFGYTVTSTIEGCHLTIKAYLRRSTFDLKGVYDRHLLFWAAQQSSIADSEAQDQQKPRHNTNHPMLTNLIRHIHNYALQKPVLEIQKVPWQATSCSCTIRVAYGPLCCHEVFEFLRAMIQLSKADIHRHWWFNHSQNLDAIIRINIIDPRVIPTRGALGGLSTETGSSKRRHPSQFEHTIQEELREVSRVRGHDHGQNQVLPGRLKRKRGGNADYIEDSHSKTRIPLHIRVSGSTAALGIFRLEVHGDLYEPETTSE
ncbi:hypothetical protein GcC1_210054 [Golovinomyces cichoracearum]|uniref:MULE transposase domain-containing protein n=1 Tax=Golovinomyces cichoracearum TaxID=62708 RepID=A0A420HAV0_9PEZI|nr:hypothetical protein GcC1_210054 [Golovinomyces cichoracearum]